MKTNQLSKAKKMKEEFEDFHKRHCDFMGGISSNVVEDYWEWIEQALIKAREDTITEVFVDIGLGKIKEGDNWKEFYKLTKSKEKKELVTKRHRMK